jgi:hypothetical protein
MEVCQGEHTCPKKYSLPNSYGIKVLIVPDLLFPILLSFE